MKWKHIHIIVSLGIVLMWAGCTSDSADGLAGGTKSEQHELRLSMGMDRFMETRALPAGYEVYDYATDLAPIQDIVGFMAYMEDPSDSQTSTHIPCYFVHEKSGSTPNHIWTSRVVLQNQNDYFFYGYMPDVHATDATIALKPDAADFSTGAVITLTGLNGISPDDICIINGFKQYKPGESIPDMRDAVGQFAFAPAAGDNLYLLATHIYAGMKFQMKLDENYAKVRKIYLKSLKVIPAQVAKTIKATITLSSDQPVQTQFEIEEAATAQAIPAVLYEGAGKELTTTNQAFLACLCPTLTQSTDYILETTYDVYDRKGNLIRQDQKAQNKLRTPSSLTAGQINIVNITVQPTYLYNLSDEDVGDPVLVIGS